MEDRGRGLPGTTIYVIISVLIEPKIARIVGSKRNGHYRIDTNRKVAGLRPEEVNDFYQFT
jgi:hypothetical protein